MDHQWTFGGVTVAVSLRRGRGSRSELSCEIRQRDGAGLAQGGRVRLRLPEGRRMTLGACGSAGPVQGVSGLQLVGVRSLTVEALSLGEQEHPINALIDARRGGAGAVAVSQGAAPLRLSLA